jgi:predicted amidohydrolase
VTQDHRTIRAAAVQLSPVLFSREGTTEKIEVTIRHHALESGCFVVNATGCLTEGQIAQLSGTTGLDKALRGSCFAAIVSPEGNVLRHTRVARKAWPSPTSTCRSS